MPQKKPTTKKSKPLLPKQELFCQLYTRGNKKQFGNATQCYIDAYGIDIYTVTDKWSQDVVQNRKNYDMSRAGWYENLTKPHIKARIREILNDVFTDEAVDNETAKIIAQDHDLSAKLWGIKEFNRLKNRVIEKPPVTFTYDLTGKSMKEIEELRKELLK